MKRTCAIMAIILCPMYLFAEERHDESILQLAKGDQGCQLLKDAELRDSRKIKSNVGEYTCYSVQVEERISGYCLTNRNGFVSLSLTNTPNDLLTRVASSFSIAGKKPSKLSPIKQSYFPQGAILVTTRLPQGKSLGSLPCCLASVLLSLQGSRRLPLFGLPEIAHNPGAFRVPNVGTDWERLPPQKMKEKSEQAVAVARRSGWVPFAAEKARLLRENGLLVIKDKRNPDRLIIRDHARAWKLLEPFRVKRLISPVNPNERFELLIDEYDFVEQILGEESTVGQTAAYVLEHGYSFESNTKELQEKTAHFFASRGLTAQTAIIDLSAISTAHFPCIAFNNSEVILLAGVLELTNGEKLFAVVLPESITKTVESIARHIERETSTAEGDLYPPIDPKLPAEVKKRLEALRQFEKSSRIGVDPQLAWPQCLRNGVHLVSSRALLKYRAIVFLKIEGNKNWWFDEKGE